MRIEQSTKPHASHKFRFRQKERLWVWILASIGFLSRIALAFCSDGQIASRPYTEDAFYAFSCARQIALGHGFSVDGVHPTNGVQPLICLLYAPCFWIANDKWLGLRLTFIVSGLVQFASVILIGRLLSQLRENTDGVSSLWQSSSVIGALLWILLAPLFIQNVNGLETGLVALLILASLSYYSFILKKVAQPFSAAGGTFSPSHALGFGVLLGLAVLARIDCILLVAAFALYELRRSRRRSLKAVLLFGLVAIIVSSPWWIYNYATFGSFMPISGQSEALGRPIGENILQSLAAMFDILTIFFYHAYYSWPTWLTILGFVGIIVFWVIVFRWLGLRQAKACPTPLMPLVWYSVAVLVYYVFFFSAPHFMARYLHPVRVLSVIVFAMILPKLLNSAMRWSTHSLARKSVLIMLLLVAASFSIERYIHCFTAPTTDDFYRLGLWAEAHSGRVGVEQSGPTNFVSQNVVNLDGKVNPDALAARKEHQIGAYIAEQRFEYLADWSPTVTALVKDAAQYGAEYREIDSVGYVRIYQRVSP